MITHGTATGYTYYGCRCDDCKTANSARNKEYYLKNKSDILARGKDYRASHPDRQRTRQREYAANHREQINANVKKRREADPSKFQTYDRRSTLKRFNLTEEDFETMFILQNGACAVCFVSFDKDTPSRGAHVDHDHACCSVAGRSCGECVRGLLCSDCNTLLARAKDSEEILAAAIRYLSANTS